jgi:predicted molibdopterin-dependent oxidoreductase YjgC
MMPNSPNARPAGVATSSPLLRRLAGADRAALPFTVDGRSCSGLEGDTLFTAVLAHGGSLRRNEPSSAPRAGFCGMGACQDCWVQLADGRRLRACTTPLEAGMAIVTGTPG